MAKRPDAAEVIGRMAPYQGALGVALTAWGVINLIDWLIHLGHLGTSPVPMLTYLATGLVSVMLGALLGFDLLVRRVLRGRPDARQRGRDLLKRLAPWQGTLGLVAIGLGSWALVLRFLL